MVIDASIVCVYFRFVWAVRYTLPRHFNVVAYVRRLYALFRPYCKVLTETEGFDWQSLCCFKPPYVKFYLLREAMKR